jgi:hypothetical protein
VASVAEPSFVLGRLRAVIGFTLGLTANIALFAGIALLVGITTSWYMIEHGSSFTTVRSGPWVSWKRAATPDADPYTRARAARHISLPISGNVARTYEARLDDAGQRLHSSCDYAVEGSGLDEGWWSIAVYDDRGSLIPNAAERYGYNSSTIARGPDGSFLMTLSRDARPGNWLPTGGAGRLVLVLTLLEPAAGGDITDQYAATRGLPAIRKVACR